MENNVIVRFQIIKKNKIVDIEIPLDITAEDLLKGLNLAYSLEIAENAMHTSFLVCENPMALIKGKRTLRELGVRDGAILKYTM